MAIKIVKSTVAYQGRPLRKGQVVELPAEAEQAYVRAGQAVPAEAPAVEEPETEATETPAASAVGSDTGTASEKELRAKLEELPYKELKTLAKDLEPKSQKTDDLIDAIVAAK